MAIWKIFLAIWFAMYCIIALTDVKFKMYDILSGICAGLIVIFLIVEARYKPAVVSS